MTLILRDALLPGGERVDVHIDDGVIAAVRPTGSPVPEGSSIDDLAGWLLLPAMAEPHAHIDKALTADLVPNRTGDLMGAIDAWVAAAQAGVLTRDDMVARATAALERLLYHGVTAVRSHVNVGEAVGASSVEAMVEVKATFDGLMDVQLVALTHAPMTGPGSQGNRAALEAAVEAGVDVIGGCPHIDPDGAACIAHALDVAVDAGLPVDLHMDETLNPDKLEIVDLARQIIDRGFDLPVAASHCVSLSMQPLVRQVEAARLLAEARVSVVTLPQTNLFLQGREHPTASPRGITPIAVLRSEGVRVAAGADNVQDPFNTVGRSDPLETAALLVMAGHQFPDVAYDLVSNEVRQVMGLRPVTMTPGDPADLVAIDAPSTRGAIADAPMARRVYRRGRLVAQASQTITIHR